jgi:DNA replication protein DnaD
MTKGYISISREIKEHWIVDNPVYFRAWIFMLMTANFKEGKLLLGSKAYTIKRGQASLSIRSWANEFKMSAKAVENFFKLLQDEGMINRQVIGKGKQSTTLVTINNYDKYQLWVETQEKRNGIERETLGVDNIIMIIKKIRIIKKISICQVGMILRRTVKKSYVS